MQDLRKIEDRSLFPDRYTIEEKPGGFMPTTSTSPVRWTTEDLVLFEGDRANRYEIIEGELFVTRAPDWKHQAVCGNIVTVFNNCAELSTVGQAAVMPGVIFCEANNVIPDVVWASFDRLEQLLDEAGHLVGAPELVVEVLSPGEKNERRDREAKLKLYSVQGVLEYWIVNRFDRSVAVYRREDGILKRVATLYETDDITSPILLGFRCLVSQFF